MRIVNVEVANFRALENLSVPLQQFSVLLGENDVGKTSFLYALEKFFIGKKLSDPKDWYKRQTNNAIRIIITFEEFPQDEELADISKANGQVVVSKVFAFDRPPEVRAILEDSSAVQNSSTHQQQMVFSNQFSFYSSAARSFSSVFNGENCSSREAVT